MRTMPALHPRHHLVAALHARGVCYLAPTPVGDEPAMGDEALILGLANGGDARLRFALAALLLRQPHLGALACALADAQADTATSEWIINQHVAAMYLQFVWAHRLRDSYGEPLRLEPRYFRIMGLETPETNHGEIGLWQLCQRSEFNDWDTYMDLSDQLIECGCEPEWLNREVRSHV
jgi:hypothetical protein